MDPDINYFIECSSELLESTPDTYQSMVLANNKIGYDVASLFYDNHSISTQAIMHIAERDMAHFQKHLFSQIENEWITFQSLFAFPYQYSAFVDTLKNRIIDSFLTSHYGPEDTFLGTMSQEHPPFWIHDSHDMVHPFIIHEFIQHYPQHHWFSRFNDFIDNRLPTINPQRLETALEHFHTHENKFIVQDTDTTEIASQAPRSLNRSDNKKQKDKQARRSVKKAIKLFSSLFGEKRIKAFLNGSSFTIEGRYFDYIIKPSKTSIVEHTKKPSSQHIPYSLEIADKQHGVIIGNLCVVIPDTPVIDQIIAIMLHLQSDEETVLKKAHLMNVNSKVHWLRDSNLEHFFSVSKKSAHSLNVDTPTERDSCRNYYAPYVTEAIHNEMHKHMNLNDSLLHFLKERPVSFDELLYDYQNRQNFDTINYMLEQFCG